jgi:SAM-dependent methyltransferase
LQLARQRLGTNAVDVNWIEADITKADLPEQAYDLWHDRAVFHFLTAPEARARYVDQARRTVRVGGHVLVATFAEDGPRRCSGLDVIRYSPGGLHAEFGAGFTLLGAAREEHRTPTGEVQAFTYCVCQRSAGVRSATG